MQHLYPEPGGPSLLIERQCPDLPAGADEEYADGFYGSWRVLTVGSPRVFRSDRRGRSYRSRLVAEGPLGEELGEGKYAQGLCPAVDINPHNTDELALLADEIPTPAWDKQHGLWSK